MLGVFRRRNPEVEAMQIGDDNYTAVRAWVNAQGGRGMLGVNSTLIIADTKTGARYSAPVGYWVVKDADGYFMVFEPGDFENGFTGVSHEE